MDRSRRVALYLILAVGSILITIGVLEVSLRLWSLFSYHPPTFQVTRYDSMYGWRLIPSVEKENRGFHVKINSQGFRDDVEYLPEKKPGLPRIIVFGDSFTFGALVAVDETFPKKLEGSLGRAEVMNFGTSGYGTDQELLLLQQEGKKYSPDLVLIALYLGNDVADNAAPVAEHISRGKPFFTLVNGLLSLQRVPVPQERQGLPSLAQPRDIPAAWELVEGLKHALAPLLAGPTMGTFSERLRMSAKQIFVVRLLVEGLKGIPIFYRVMVQAGVITHFTEHQIRLLEALLKEIDRTSRDMHSKTLVVLIPLLDQVYRDLTPNPYDGLAATVVEIGRQHRIPVLDLTPSLRERARASQEKLYFMGEGHWSRAGHALAAAEIARFIRARQLLSGS